MFCNNILSKILLDGLFIYTISLSRVRIRSKILVEYTSQSIIEGEIQQLTEEQIEKLIYGELWELIIGKKVGRVDDNEITLFDSVGFALEDFSILRLVYDLSKKYRLGKEMDLIPVIINPKNLISVLN